MELGDGTIVIDDSYNANPASVRAALATLVDLAKPSRRSVAVLGEMKEIGDAEESEHDAIGVEVARLGVGLLVTAGGLASRIATEAARSKVETRVAESAEAAAKIALAEIRPGDVVLVKGSRSVGTELVFRALVGSRGRREAP
ncbi:hypothetical protein BH09MYX1_BH09MYX1_60540 [soil metagenome]